MTKIFVVGHQIGYATPFLSELNATLTDDIESADILWFTGGEDVDPAAYGEEPHPRSYYNSQRTYMEDQIIRLYPDKFKVGTCRGHQQFNVAVGGKLIQHVNNHAGRSHKVLEVNTGDEYFVNSAHHQMIIPHKCEVLMLTPHQLSTTQEHGSGVFDTPIDEVEAAYWPSINAFGIQFHPEWMDENEPVRKWFIDKVKEYFNVHKGN